MKGYVALTTILVILPLLLLTGIDSLYNNLSGLIIGKMNYDSQILKSNSETCIEEAVYRIKRNESLITTFDISLANWSCTVGITDKEGYTGIKIIEVTAIDDNGISLTTKKELDVNVNPYEISNL